MANVNVKMEVIGEGIILATNANGDQRIFSADTQMQAAADKAYDWAYGNNVQSAEPDIQEDVQTVSKSASEETQSVDETDSTSEAAGNPTTASDQKVDTEVAPTEEPKKRRKRRTKAEIEAANQAKNEQIDTETVNVSEQQASQESEESKDDFDFDFNDSDTVANANSDVTDAGAETHEDAQTEDVDDFFDLLEDDGSTENHEDDFGDFTDIDFTDIDNSSSETASEVVTENPETIPTATDMTLSESDEVVNESAVDDKIKELGAVKITFATYKTPTPIEEIYQSSGGVALLKRALNNKLLKSQLKDNIRAYLEAKGDI